MLQRRVRRTGRQSCGRSWGDLRLWTGGRGQPPAKGMTSGRRRYRTWLMMRKMILAILGKLPTPTYLRVWNSLIVIHRLVYECETAYLRVWNSLIVIHKVIYECDISTKLSKSVELQWNFSYDSLNINVSQSGKKKIMSHVWETLYNFYEQLGIWHQKQFQFPSPLCNLR